MSAGSPRAAIAWRTCPTSEVAPDALPPTLGATERRRALTIPHVHARQRFVAARLLLHRLVATRVPEAPAALDIGATPSGRPQVVGAPQLELSVSHTRGLAVVAACTTGPIGIDVEPATRADLPPAHVWLTAREEQQVRALPTDARRRQLSLWVGKEAALKSCDRLGPVGRRGVEVRRVAVPATPPTGHDPPDDAVLVAVGRAVIGVTTTPTTVQRVLRWYEVGGGAFLVALAHPT